MTKFLGTLCSDQIGKFHGRVVHKLLRNLVWMNGCKVAVLPFNMETDLASVPRLPLIFWWWGDRVHREAVLHDGTYRCGFKIYVFRSEAEAWIFALAAHEAATFIPEAKNAVMQDVPKEDGDWYFREAMIGQGNSYAIYHPMYLAVRCAGDSSYHRMKVMDNFQIEQEG